MHTGWRKLARLEIALADATPRAGVPKIPTDLSDRSLTRALSHWCAAHQRKHLHAWRQVLWQISTAFEIPASQVVTVTVQEQTQRVPTASQAEWELRDAVIWWARAHKKKHFQAWKTWEGSALSPSDVFKLMSLIQWAAQAVPRRALFTWRNRLTQGTASLGRHGSELPRQLMKIFDHIMSVRILHAWASWSRRCSLISRLASNEAKARGLTRLVQNAFSNESSRRAADFLRSYER